MTHFVPLASAHARTFSSGCSVSAVRCVVPAGDSRAHVRDPRAGDSHRQGRASYMPRPPPS